MYGTIGIIELSTGELVLGIDQDVTPVGPQMVFDKYDQLNFRVGNRGPVKTSGSKTEPVGFAFMACDLAGTCWLSSGAVLGSRSNSCCRTGSDHRGSGAHDSTIPPA